MISTDIIISATRHLPPTSRCLALATQQVSWSSTEKHSGEHIVKCNWECLQAYWECTWKHGRERAWECLGYLLGSIQLSMLGVRHRVQLGASLRACPGVCLRVSWELAWECTVKQAGSVSLSAIESALESTPGSVLQSGVRAYLRGYNQAGWECVIEFNWERPREHAREYAWYCTWRCTWECALNAFGSLVWSLLNAGWCVLSSAHNSMCIIVI